MKIQESVSIYAGLLSSMARLRFTRWIHWTEDNEKVTEEDSRKIDVEDST